MRTTVAVTGALTALGGLAWVVKGAAILATGDQPPFFFEIAPILLPIGLLGSFTLLERPGRLGLAGFVAAVVALAAGTVAFLRPPADNEFSPAMLAATIALLTAAMLLGGRLRREAALAPAPASSLPLWLGIGTFPALAVGGALTTIDERLLEVPLVVLGLAWALLGAALVNTARVHDRRYGSRP